MDVSVIIVTYNSAECIGDCVASVLSQEGVEAEIIVIDNASSDGTLNNLRELGSSVQVIANDKNLGFGCANNQAFAGSRGRFVYLLNPDAKLIQRGALAHLCRTMEGHPEWGVAGTRILSAEGQAVSPPATSYPGQRFAQRDFSRLPGNIAWVMGASMCFPRAVFGEIGGFDQDIFLSSEDTEICLRLREKGYAIGFVEGVAITHIGGASDSDRDPYQVSLCRLNGLHSFYRKHYPVKGVIRLARRDIRRARLRMSFYYFAKQFPSAGSKANRKYRSYQAVRDASRLLLQELLVRGQTGE